MKTLYKTIPVMEFSLDGLRESINQIGDLMPFEYRLGTYYEMDTDTIGEMANIMRLLENGFLPLSEKEAITNALDDRKLNPAGRKAKERGIQRLKNLLLK
jgi:hypothetical protein